MCRANTAYPSPDGRFPTVGFDVRRERVSLQRSQVEIEWGEDLSGASAGVAHQTKKGLYTFS